MAEPQRSSPFLTIQHFPKTIEGAEIIRMQMPFILGGRIYQGFRGVPVSVDIMALTDQELAEAHDVDQTKHIVQSQRDEKRKAARYFKEKELGDREAARRVRERDELELQKLRREMGVVPPQEAKEEAQAAHEAFEQASAEDWQEPVLPPTEPKESCSECGKLMPKKKMPKHVMGHRLYRSKLGREKKP